MISIGHYIRLKMIEKYFTCLECDENIILCECDD